MSHKGTYAEYTKTFPRMMQDFRANLPKVEGCEGSVAFLLENEIRIIEKARYFAGRENYRIKYFNQALAIIDDTDLDWPVISELRQWQPTVARMVQEAESYRDYRLTADFVGRLNTAVDAVMLGKGSDAKALLETAITSLPVADDNE